MDDFGEKAAPESGDASSLFISSVNITTQVVDRVKNDSSWLVKPLIAQILDSW